MIILLSLARFLEFILDIGSRESPIYGWPGTVPFIFPTTDFVCFGFWAAHLVV
jgi:hypothetical protein